VRKALVTGGSGFIGAYLVRRLVADGWSVSVVDNLARGRTSRLRSVVDQIEWHQADVRDVAAVGEAAAGAEVIFHLAAVNGTENFYNHPDLVLDVGIRGVLAVVEAAARADVPDLVVASSAEVYQTPPKVPTPEDVPLMLPNSLNPRYSYGGSKIITELVAFNYFRDHFRKVQAFRPHNIYGPDMGWKHVLPQFILRGRKLASEYGNRPIAFPIQGDGLETRAFCYVDDAVEGIVSMYDKGEHRNVYHIGNPEMVPIRRLVELLADYFEVEFAAEPSELAEGGTRIRCPDISKMIELGFQPRISLAEGMRRTADWYVAAGDVPENDLL